MLNKESYTAVKITPLNVWDISFCSNSDGRGHHQQQPCKNKMIPWLFTTTYKKQKNKTEKKKSEKKEEKCPMVFQCQNA